jgi:hypothetical protein
MRESLGPTFDQGFAALVTDLDERALLNEVAVLATAEFGRTPQINRAAGRDHWPWAYSIALAGVSFSEVLRRSAAIADRLSIVRSMSHDNPNHVQASLPAMTGHAHPREDDEWVMHFAQEAGQTGRGGPGGC